MLARFADMFQFSSGLPSPFFSSSVSVPGSLIAFCMHIKHTFVARGRGRGRGRAWLGRLLPNIFVFLSPIPMNY